jgi:hypothetical protein
MKQIAIHWMQLIQQPYHNQKIMCIVPNGTTLRHTGRSDARSRLAKSDSSDDQRTRNNHKIFSDSNNNESNATVVYIQESGLVERKIQNSKDTKLAIKQHA